MHMFAFRSVMVGAGALIFKTWGGMLSTPATVVTARSISASDRAGVKTVWWRHFEVVHGIQGDRRRSWSIEHLPIVSYNASFALLQRRCADEISSDGQWCARQRCGGSYLRQAGSRGQPQSQVTRLSPRRSPPRGLVLLAPLRADADCIGRLVSVIEGSFSHKAFVLSVPFREGSSCGVHCFGERRD